MNRWFFLLILIAAAVAICGVVSHFAAPEVGTTTRYGMELQATAVAATPDTSALLNQNRASLAEVEANSGTGAWVGIAIFLMILSLLGAVVAILVAAPNTLKQGRLAFKAIGGGSRTRRPDYGRVRTIPQIPSLNQQTRPHLPAQVEQEAEWYE